MVSQFPLQGTSLFEPGRVSCIGFPQSQESLPARAEQESRRARMSETELKPGRNPLPRLDALLWARLEAPMMAPIRAFRLAYLPLLTIYLASGALGITAVADTFWVKQSLTLTP